ncbi:MAG: (d)CMP kinase [Actinobacteria bacterium]|nr:(d)CMP kinase [Actinomycetota bacterium]
MIVAIDGPAGAGKSSVARGVAAALGFTYLDTGALYRTIALAALQQGIAPSDGPALGALAGATAIELDGVRVLMDGRDVSERIRDADVTELVSVISAHPAVRSALLLHQQHAASSGDIVIEGRDIGTAVAPDAAVKVFLTASPEERARRRAAQLGLPMDADTLKELAEDLAARDRADETRASSPLTRAADAIEMDTTDMTQEEVIAAIVELTRRAAPRG